MNACECLFALNSTAFQDPKAQQSCEALLVALYRQAMPVDVVIARMTEDEAAA